MKKSTKGGVRVSVPVFVGIMTILALVVSFAPQTFAGASVLYCGDGDVQQPNDDGLMEYCDGTNFGGATCVTEGYDDGSLTCSSDCASYSMENCFDYACDNDVLDPGEVCEIDNSQTCPDADGYFGWQDCNQDCMGWSTCISEHYCGDGIVDENMYGSEECDDSNNTNGDGCSATCQIEPPATARLRAFKYFDSNQNGVYDAGDYSLPNWRIILYDGRGTVLISDKRTGADGWTSYWEDVPVANPTNLVLQEDPPSSGWIAINPAESNGSGTYWGLAVVANGEYDFSFGNWKSLLSDTDQDGISAEEDNCPLASNADQNDDDGDGVGNICDNCPSDYNPDQENICVLAQYGSISGQKFNDLDGDGIWDDGEPTLSGWTIYVDADGDDEFDEVGEMYTETDIDGAYNIQLLSGTYTIREVMPAGWTQTKPGGSASAQEYTIPISAGQHSPFTDFGNHQDENDGACSAQNPPAEWAVYKNGFYWAWASPCDGGCSIADPNRVPGWRYATEAEWLLRPEASDFMVNDVLKCASPYFDDRYTHCDYGDGAEGRLSRIPSGSWWESWYIYDCDYVAPHIPQCSDDVDNEDSEDELIDAADPGCHTDGDASNESSYDPEDDDETDVEESSRGGGGTPQHPYDDNEEGEVEGESTEGEVLGEQVAVVPAGAVGTGFGGTAGAQAMAGTGLLFTLLGLTGLSFASRKD